MSRLRCSVAQNKAAKVSVWTDSFKEHILIKAGLDTRRRLVYTHTPSVLGYYSATVHWARSSVRLPF